MHILCIFLARIKQEEYLLLVLSCIFPVIDVKVWSPDKWRGVADTQLWTRSLPQPVQDRVGTVERVLRDGHACHEKGEQRLTTDTCLNEWSR